MITAFQDIHPRLGARSSSTNKHACLATSIWQRLLVWPMAVVRGDVNKIRIGARTSVQDNAVLHVTHDGPYSRGGADLSIGDDVTIGHGVILHACRIGNRCLIGMGSIILDKAVLEDGAFRRRQRDFARQAV